jgi:hypothetical protein
VRVEVNGIVGNAYVELNDEGVIDKDVEIAFTRGHCHSFAMALQAVKPNLQLVGVDWLLTSCEAFHGELELLPGHVLCRDVAGNLWDVRGLVTDAYDPAPVSDELIESEFYGEYRDADPTLAAPYLAAWFAAHGQEVIG